MADWSAVQASINRQDSMLCLLEIDGQWLALFTVQELRTAAERAKGWVRRPDQVRRRRAREE